MYKRQVFKYLGQPALILCQIKGRTLTIIQRLPVLLIEFLVLLQCLLSYLSLDVLSLLHLLNPLEYLIEIFNFVTLRDLIDQVVLAVNLHLQILSQLLLPVCLLDLAVLELKLELVRIVDTHCVP